MMAGAAASVFVESKINQRPVVLFGKTYCPDSRKVNTMLKEEYTLDHKNFEVVNVERRQDVNEIEDYFMICCLSERREFPQLWIKGKYIGSEFKIRDLHAKGELSQILTEAGLTVPSINTFSPAESNSKVSNSAEPMEKEETEQKETEKAEQ